MSSNVTMKSTKQEIMDALKEAQAELEKRKSVIADPTAANRETAENDCIKAAAEDVKANIFSKEMNEKYENLANAITIMEQKLKDQYEVEAALLKLVTVTNAAKELQLKLEEQYKQRKAEIETEMQEMKAANNEEQKKMERELAEKKRLTDIERAREEEEYKYNLARERKIEDDKYKDAKAQADKKLKDVKDEAMAIEAENKEKSAEIADMRQKIEDFPSILQEKYDAGVADGKKEADKEYGYKTAMTDKEHGYEVRERDNRIERLEAEVKEKADKITSLENKLDAAYAQLRELAAKTVESNGSIKVIGGSSDNTSKR